MTDPSRPSTDPYDKVRPDVLEAIARTGYCYSNEACAIARELVELRARLGTERNELQFPLFI